MSNRLNYKNAIAVDQHGSAVLDDIMGKRKPKASDMPKAAADDLSLRDGEETFNYTYVRVQIPLRSREGIKRAPQILRDLADELERIGRLSKIKERWVLVDACRASRRANDRLRLSVPGKRYFYDPENAE